MARAEKCLDFSAQILLKGVNQENLIQFAVKLWAESLWLNYTALGGWIIVKMNEIKYKVILDIVSTPLSGMFFKRR